MSKWSVVFDVWSKGVDARLGQGATQGTGGTAAGLNVIERRNQNVRMCDIVARCSHIAAVVGRWEVRQGYIQDGDVIYVHCRNI